MKKSADDTKSIKNYPAFKELSLQQVKVCKQVSISSNISSLVLVSFVCLALHVPIVWGFTVFRFRVLLSQEECRIKLLSKCANLHVEKTVFLKKNVKSDYYCQLKNCPARADTGLLSVLFRWTLFLDNDFNDFRYYNLCVSLKVCEIVPKVKCSLFCICTVEDQYVVILFSRKKTTSITRK